ncbi:MAG TPA: DNA polymerase/3'-5' exonuclease PolX [Thermoleophilia bacterium]
MPSRPSNAQIVRLFDLISDYLALDDESPYRMMAYERASRTLRDYPVSIADLASRGGLRELPGIGEAIETKVLEFIVTGEVAKLDELRAKYPEGLLEIMHLPGVGPKTARHLWEALAITNLDELKLACERHALRGLPGMGEKTETNMLRAIATYEARSGRSLAGAVEPQAAKFVEALRAMPAVISADYAGSLRRRRSTIRDIDLVVASADPSAVMDAFAALPELAGTNERGDTKLTAVTHTELNVDLRIVPEPSYGNLLQHLTGSAGHNVALRAYAQRRGHKICEYNVEHVASGRQITCATEAEVYELVGLRYIPPELRENQGEIEASEEGLLPDLIELPDVRGDLHVHSDWTDGRATIEDMALGALEHGLEYMCFCDHSQSLAMARGLGPDRLAQQMEVIRELNTRLPGITLLCGIEVDILADGRLDLPDESLAQLDFVTASIHSAFSQPRAQIMKRMTNAMQNPYVRSIGHPTGRLLGRREPYDVDLDELARLAAETGTFLEINASYDRLDLSGPAVRRAVELGAKIVICTDAHYPTDFDNLKYAIWEGRRGWLEAKDVVNTRPLSEFRAYRKA